MTGLPVSADLATRPLGIRGVVRTARRNLLEIIPVLATRQPMVSGKMVRRWHMVMDPQALRRVLLEKPRSYPKSEVTRNVLGPVIGDSLFLAEGRHWLWQKRAVAPVFSSRNITNLGPVMTAAAGRMLQRVAEQDGCAVDMHAEFTAAAFEVINDVLFSGEGAIDRSVARRAIDIYVNRSARTSLLDIVGAPSWMPRLGRLRPAREVVELRRIADDSIRCRRQSERAPVGDLHDLMAAASDPKTGRRMNPRELRDNLLTFVVAGHETTALALSWALYLLAFDAGMQERVRDEIAAAGIVGLAKAGDLERLPLTFRVIREALRLYPPAGILVRTALEQDELGGREVRPGDTILIPLYALHRSHCLWEDPDAFLPDRFANPDRIDRFQYLPFGDGPRACIGSNFAMQEAGILLASLLARFRFTAIDDRQPRPVMILTLRPQGGVWLQSEPVAG